LPIFPAAARGAPTGFPHAEQVKWIALALSPMGLPRP
jgi:hypothetical protein